MFKTNIDLLCLVRAPTGDQTGDLWPCGTMPTRLSHAGQGSGAYLNVATSSWSQVGTAILYTVMEPHV